MHLCTYTIRVKPSYRTPPTTSRERLVPITDSPRETLAKSLLLKSVGENNITCNDQNKKMDGDHKPMDVVDLRTARYMHL